MSGTLNHLMAAMVLFVGGHFVLSSAPFRGPFVVRFGERTFNLVYSIIVIAAFAWIVEAYRVTPVIPVWYPAPAFAWVSAVLVPPALFLAIAGMSGLSPILLASSEEMWAGRDPTAGVIRITRHPFLVGVVLWSSAHLLNRGDAAAIVLFGGFLILALGGIWRIEKKKAARLGAAWGPILLTTSILPFAALLSGRAKMDWRGIGLWRPALTIAVWLGLGHLHPAVPGLTVWPG